MNRTPLSRSLSTATLTVLLLGMAGGCVEKTELSAAQRQQVEGYVRHEAPTPQHPLDVSFEDKIILLGYDVEPDTWRPGESLRVTWHWKVDRPLEEGWKLFTHVVNNGGGNQINADGEGVIRGLYAPGQWRAGEYIEDVQELTLPANWNSPQATFYVGFWKGPHRLRIIRGSNDGDNRARAFSIPTPAAAQGQRPPSQPAVPSLTANKTSTPPTIDGRLDDAVWTSASAPTAAFVNTMNGGTAEPTAHARVLWDDENLYVGYDILDDHLKSSFTEHDDHLWEQDAAEIFLDPSGRGLNYFELQVSPRGVSFDTRYDSRRQPGPIGHADWESHMRAAAVARGTIDDDGEDQGYSVEIAIPWSAFAAGTPQPSKPTAGTVWRVNFYVMDAREEGQRAVGWSAPRVGDFHVPNRFGRLIFADPSAPTTPVPAAHIGSPATSPAGMSPLGLRPGATQLLPRVVEQQLRTRERRTQFQLDNAERRNRPQQGEPVPTPPTTMNGAMAPSAMAPSAMAPSAMAPSAMAPTN